MAFSFNGSTPKEIYYNNQEVKKLIYNNVVVWTKRLPSGFQEVEYIESTGTQFIDTGFVANQDSRFVMKIQYNDGNFIFGSDGSNSGNLKAVGLNKSSTKFRWHYDNQGYIDSGTFTYGNIYDIDANKNLMYLNGDLIASFDYADFQTPSSVIISGISRNNQINMERYGSSIRIYFFQIYDNEVLIRDFIPCYRKSDGVIGMYDIINETFYTNASSDGSFIKGGDV